MNTASPHILVVDDDPALRDLMSVYLSENEFQVTAVASGAEMSAILQDNVIDLVVLDLRLGGEDGMQLARGLRDSSELPVIIVTGKQDEADRVMGLEIAADDYVTKPFSNREMLARIRAVLRRYQVRSDVGSQGRSTKRRAYRFAGWELNLLARRLTSPGGQRVELSNGEFNLLLALCEQPQRVLSRDQLLEASRLHGAEVYDRSIDVQILRLRRKIEVDASAPKMIRTERGAGYVFEPQVQVLH
ncbi:response regulator [Variovorax sp. J22P168]|uniref:response regulator n=1 Tax=Variovorax jilinensis TaxID=3053513 RepID=UPI002575627E|nr:response regulator [Variovorax sp. J22P168]MDM0014811.1 response regulator [Variovorax sp. J22P168]